MRKMNVTAGYPTIVPINLAISTSKMMSTITKSECLNCNTPNKFDAGRYTGDYNNLNYKVGWIEYSGTSGA
jgi:hypothetical protein